MPEAKKPAQKAAPAKTSAKAETKEVKVTRTSVDKNTVFVPSGTYNPKAAHNVASYEAVVAVTPGTYDDMAKAIPQHTDFIGYLVRRGGLVPQKRDEGDRRA